MVNSTFSGNTATVGFPYSGGAIYTGNPLTVINSTFVNNSAHYGGSIENQYFGGTVSVSNSLFAENSALTGGSIDGGGTGVNAQYNLYWNNSGGDCTAYCTNNNAVNAAPFLGALANNGGPTQTYLPSIAGAAIYAGSDNLCDAAPVNSIDQRGARRPQGPHCDIGAAELVVDRLFADNFDGTPTP